ncbi:carboxylate--amine ligase [Oceanobacillus alkalisoli]|uniref:carboxylate--amine ligase n=1 Tax=Oceanobacillus alkalisoli TaxID=2925113 RepID=UPI001EF0AAC5|nr:carboxylate--amine ligase [Oceanobacillus alkalisoli]MCF3944019.1 carboxylate--amine ligase [Oceanobacillus alkalisoli]MCG5103291.1 carboxylate--amine ligase [Oceanobacillus alkalisoli]
MNNQSFTPVIIGTDINAYNMAISFHEAYDIHPILVGKQEMGFTSFSTIPERIDIHPDLTDKGRFVPILKELAESLQNRNHPLILVGTNDAYVRLIIEHDEELKNYYRFTYISEDLMNQLQKKANFYKLCREYGIDTPATSFYDCNDDAPFTEEMTYPIIIKPSNGIEYYKHPFTGQEKVYRVNTPEETDKVIKMIKESGYRDELIMQDYIPGDDTYMWDSVLYLNSKSKTELVTFGQVVLQEHTATAIGNYTSVLTRYNEEMMKKLQQFLETVGYVGFANFDMKYDERDGKFKIFEVNIRQGRSSYYVTALGHNMAKYIVDDVLHDKEKSTTYLNEEYLFSVVPRIVLNNFVENDAVKQDVNRLIKQKKWGNPLFYKKDKSFKRKFYMLLRQFNYYRKYKNNKW